MTNNQITFNDLPQVVAELRDEVSGMKALLLENRHRPVTPEQVAEYTNIPLATIYQKLANREIPGSKPGKRWVIYLDEIDKWLEANRKNPIPLTDEEQNAAILASHKRKPNKSSWQTDPIVEPSKKVNVAIALMLLTFQMILSNLTMASIQQNPTMQPVLTVSMLAMSPLPLTD